MNKEFWMPILLPLLDFDKEMGKFGEQIYNPKDWHDVVFWFDGGLTIKGTQENLSLNLKSPDLMVIMCGLNPTKIFRIPYSRLVCFELIIKKKGKKDDSLQFFRN